MPKRMQEVKESLYQKYGTRCEVCGEKFPRRKLTGHHIIPKRFKGEITEENILIACYNCHFGKINHIEYDSEEYWSLMEKSLEHRTEEPTS